MIKKLFLFFFVPFFCFSQNVVSEEHELNNNGIYLPGTLSIPKLNQPMPLAVFLHGSGAIDRNGNQGFFIQGNYIKQLADSLNKNGIALYRYDKRTIHAKNIKKNSPIYLADFVTDAETAIEHFKSDKRFSSIHLLGHSQGSLTAMLVKPQNISSYISLAGAAQSIDKIIISQVSRQDSLLGLKAKKHFEELMASDTIKKVDPMLLSIFAPQNQLFLKDWATIEPQNEIKKLSIPILIINGDKDLQVPISEAEILHRANPKSKLIIVENLNHVLKDIQKKDENLKSYTDPSIAISGKLVETIVEFIKKHG